MNKIETYEPQMGDYGVIRTNGIAARLIQLGTLSRWNHAVIYQGNDYVVEANPTGVAISHISKYDGKPIAWNRHDNVTAEQRHKIVFHARELIGKRYNFFIILGLVLRIFGVKILGNYILKKMADKDGYICSELVAECYRLAGMPLGKEDYLIVPGDLAERLIWQ